VSKKSRKQTNAQRRAQVRYKLSKFEHYKLVSLLAGVINRYFPHLLESFSQLPDNRKRPRYKVKELLVSGLLMFIFQQGSRNQADNTAKGVTFRENIARIFGIKLSSLDTVHEYLKFLPTERLELVKQLLFRQLLKTKVLSKYRYRGKYYVLAIDGTGIQSYDYEPYPGCPYKQYKSGKKIWTAYALEAKIVTNNGFSISLATEWVENSSDGNFAKQDCEFKAFKRLTSRIKRAFPRLELILVLDGLYPKEPVFQICETNKWKFAITLKDKTLKSVQEQLQDRLLFGEYEQIEDKSSSGTHWIEEEYQLFKDIEYKGVKYSVIETNVNKRHKKSGKRGKPTRFVHISNVELELSEVKELSRTARMRWKIENEGFNRQKNSDYDLGHKYSRKSFTNYYSRKY